MITLFTATKAFRGDDGTVQRDALSSWRRLLPRCEIVLFGDEPGTSEAARTVGAVHVPDVETSEGGTPLLNDMFARVQEIGRHDLFCFVRADLIFLSNLTEQVGKHRTDFGDDFLLAGHFWNTRIEDPIDFDANWEPLLRWQVSRRGKLSGDAGFGYCLYPRGRHARIPSFAVGSPDFDGWMIGSCIKAGTRVIDASSAITAVRQLQGDGRARDHGAAVRGEVARHDLRAAGWKLTSAGVLENRLSFRRWRQAFRMSGTAADRAGDRLAQSADSTASVSKEAQHAQGRTPVTALPGGSEALVSVVICTYNRADLLGVCMESLVRQDAGGFEIIVVDNNSTDETSEIAAGFADRDVPIRYVFEPEQGLSPARNCGWREARGRYVAYVDDECRMPRDWIRNMTATILAHAPEMLGGPYDACFDGPSPAWYRRPYFSTVWKGVTLRAMGPNEFLAGGNMAIRRDLFDHIGAFDPKLGMKGGAVAYGEETAFQKRLMKMMPEAQRLYDPALSVDHLVRNAKLGIKELLQQRIAAGRSGWRMAVLIDEAEPKDGMKNAELSRDLAVTAAKLAWHLLIGLPFRKRALYPYPQNYLREAVGLSAARLGRLLEQRRDLKPDSGSTQHHHEG